MNGEESRLMIIGTIFSQHRYAGRMLSRMVAAASQENADKHVGLLLGIHEAMSRLGDERKAYVSELIRETHDSPQSVSRILRMLEKEGLLERYAEPTDRRKTYVILTEAGERAIAGCTQRMKLLEETLVERMGKERIEQLCADYEELLKNIGELTVGISDAEMNPPAPLPPQKPRKDKKEKPKKDKKDKKSGKKNK